MVCACPLARWSYSFRPSAPPAPMRVCALMPTCLLAPRLTCARSPSDAGHHRLSATGHQKRDAPGHQERKKESEQERELEGEGEGEGERCEMRIFFLILPLNICTQFYPSYPNTNSHVIPLSNTICFISHLILLLFYYYFK